MLNIVFESNRGCPIHQRSMEFVERKGTGHPDSICDSLAESVSIALSRSYVEETGRVLHFNIDKALLAAGKAKPELGGGRVEQPMRLVLGDRATVIANNHRMPVTETVVHAVETWLRRHLRFVSPHYNVIVQNELRPSSAELLDIFSREQLVANDTSAVVGYAPLSETERLTLAVEFHLNSPEFKKQFPETGEDVKVMSIRNGRTLHVTVAMAFIDRYFKSEKEYFDRREFIERNLQRFLEPKLRTLDQVRVQLNCLDVPGRGLGGMYLTVLGTSAENADSGQVGRGNRVNGLISLMRPMSIEAAAGKNPTCHVGKIYNVLAHQLAQKICDSQPAVEEATVWLCSQIGMPIESPWHANVQVSLKPGASLADVQQPIQNLFEEQFANISNFSGRLARGEIIVCSPQ